MFLSMFGGNNVKPIGEIASAQGICRWNNSTYNDIVNQLASMNPDPNNTEYVNLCKRAIEIWLQEVPEIPTISSPEMTAHNTYYWTGFPSAENPYVQMYFQCASYHIVVINLMPTKIEYTTLYFTNATRRFRGIDKIWYGPYQKGDNARVPVDDAEFWIRQGLGSYTPTELPGLEELLAVISSEANSIKTSITSLDSTLSTISATLTVVIATIAIEAIAIIILLLIVLKKKS
jgi:hypothetical protein